MSRCQDAKISRHLSSSRGTAIALRYHITVSAIVIVLSMTYLHDWLCDLTCLQKTISSQILSRRRPSSGSHQVAAIKWRPSSGSHQVAAIKEAACSIYYLGAHRIGCKARDTGIIFTPKEERGGVRCGRESCRRYRCVGREKRQEK